MAKANWFGKFKEIGISGISPEGWLRRYLEKQNAGLTGNIEKVGYPFDSCGWTGKIVPKPPLHPEFQGWWPYEQTAYAIDGQLRCGYLLGDAGLTEKARKHVKKVLSNPDRDGYLGPRHIKHGEGEDRWVHAVFFRALMAEYLATGDERIPQAMAKHYLSGTSDHTTRREMCNIESICWTYAQTGDRRLLDHAVAAYEKFNEITQWDTSVTRLLSNKRTDLHGVTFCESVKIPAILYMYTGNRRWLKAAIHGFEKAQRDHLLIDGVVSSTEALNENTAINGHETCDIADFTWSLGTMLMATGEMRWADMIERACFNAAPGAVKKDDFMAIQYFSLPNQVVAKNNSDRFYGGQHTAFKAAHSPRCCTGNFNRIMPNFAARMWMSDGEGNLAALLYGPSCVVARVGKKAQPVEIVEETSYPFSERIDFEIRTESPVEFTLRLRIPGWCENARVSVNGQPIQGKLKAGSLLSLKRRFAHNDRITLELPMTLTLNEIPGGGVAITRGPLLFALPVKELWAVDSKDSKANKDAPSWLLAAGSDWNYALALSEKTLEQDVAIEYQPATADPWTPQSAPIRLHVPARKVKGWNLERPKKIVDKDHVRKGPFELTPAIPTGNALKKKLAAKLETITLVPYGCTHLRMAILPQCGRI